MEWADRRHQSNISVKTTGTVKFTLNPKRPPALAKEAKVRLAAITDRDIDLTDIPATHGVTWKRPFFQDNRTALSDSHE